MFANVPDVPLDQGAANAASDVAMPAINDN